MERTVEVPVEKVVEVDVQVRVEKPVFREIINEEDIMVETMNETYHHV